MTSSSLNTLILAIEGDLKSTNGNAPVKKQEEADLENLLSQVEIQQRWIYLLLHRLLLLSTELNKSRNEIDNKTEMELSKLESSIGLSQRLLSEFVEKSSKALASVTESQASAEMMAQMAMDELTLAQTERIEIDIQAAERLRSLEQAFESVVKEKDEELLSLRTCVQSKEEELSSLRAQIMLQKPTSNDLKAVELASKNGSSSPPELLHTALEALWQVSSDAQQADAMIYGSTNLLSSLTSFFQSFLTTAQPVSVATFSSPSCAPIELFRAVCGILVNLSATHQGRKLMATFEHGNLLRLIIDSVGVIVNAIVCNGISGGHETWIQSLELILCIISNSCFERDVGVSFIKAGLFNCLHHVIKSSLKEPLRVYAVNIVKSTLEFAPLVQPYHDSFNSTSASSASRTTVFDEIGDIITTMSHDKQLKLLGWELVGNLQRILPRED